MIDVMRQIYGSAKFLWLAKAQYDIVLYPLQYLSLIMHLIWLGVVSFPFSPSLTSSMSLIFTVELMICYVLCMSSLNISGNDIKPVLDVVNPQHKWVFKELKHVSACSVVCYKYCRTTWCFILLDFTVVWFMFPVYSLNILLYISTFGIIVYCTAKLFKMFWK